MENSKLSLFKNTLESRLNNFLSLEAGNSQPLILLTQLVGDLKTLFKSEQTTLDLLDEVEMFKLPQQQQNQHLQQHQFNIQQFDPMLDISSISKATDFQMQPRPQMRNRDLETLEDSIVNRVKLLLDTQTLDIKFDIHNHQIRTDMVHNNIKTIKDDIIKQIQMQEIIKEQTELMNQSMFLNQSQIIDHEPVINNVAPDKDYSKNFEALQNQLNNLSFENSKVLQYQNQSQGLILESIKSVDQQIRDLEEKVKSQLYQQTQMGQQISQSMGNNKIDYTSQPQSQNVQQIQSMINDQFSSLGQWNEIQEKLLIKHSRNEIEQITSQIAKDIEFLSQNIRQQITVTLDKLKEIRQSQVYQDQIQKDVYEQLKMTQVQYSQQIISEIGDVQNKSVQISNKLDVQANMISDNGQLFLNLESQNQKDFSQLKGIVGDFLKQNEVQNSSNYGKLSDSIVPLRALENKIVLLLDIAMQTHEQVNKNANIPKANEYYQNQFEQITSKGLSRSQSNIDEEQKRENPQSLVKEVSGGDSIQSSNDFFGNLECDMLMVHQDKGEAYRNIARFPISNTLVLSGQDLNFVLINGETLTFKQYFSIPSQCICNVVIQNLLYCGFNKEIQVYNESPSLGLTLVSQIRTSTIVRKLISYKNKYVIAGSNNGIIDFIDQKTNKHLSQTQISQKKKIIDMCVLTYSTKNELAIATQGGLFINSVNFTRDDIPIILESKDHIYFPDQVILCALEIQPEILLVCIDQNQFIQVLDIMKKAVIKLISNPNHDFFYNSLLLIEDYNLIKNHYAILKDKKGLCIIDTMSFQAKKMMDSKFDEYSWKYSMLVYKADQQSSQNVILNIGYDNNNNTRQLTQIIF
ncbi:UNKNOWN [Stylonychia lemnae]|uniref:Uncharacterized protein n=1 Tax=Stylonychia lemnae TaxID=5949 RepID=A0A078AMB7_STYLE|nr:UNKNOWN [Stylonychia lemnae]|eukprot:CDW82532.1 UNKNOWN [Stylonychia lemnae]